jgi:hypothetical protein
MSLSATLSSVPVKIVTNVYKELNVAGNANVEAFANSGSNFSVLGGSLSAGTQVTSGPTNISSPTTAVISCSSSQTTISQPTTVNGSVTVNTTVSPAGYCITSNESQIWYDGAGNLSVANSVSASNFVNMNIAAPGISKFTLTTTGTVTVDYNNCSVTTIYCNMNSGSYTLTLNTNFRPNLAQCSAKIRVLAYNGNGSKTLTITTTESNALQIGTITLTPPSGQVVSRIMTLLYLGGQNYEMF